MYMCSVIMYIVGLTGGIGCGKSTVADMLADRHGIYVIDADKIAHNLQQPGSSACRAIRAAFGAAYFDEDGSLNREILGEAVFADDGMRRRLNGIMASRIRNECLRQLVIAFIKGNSLVIFDAPLFFEHGVHKLIGTVIVVACGHAAQLDRVRRRDGLTDEQIEARITSQWPIEKKIELATYVIDNDGDITATQAQVDEIVCKLRSSWRRWHVRAVIAAVGVALVFGVLKIGRVLF